MGPAGHPSASGQWQAAGFLAAGLAAACGRHGGPGAPRIAGTPAELLYRLPAGGQPAREHTLKQDQKATVSQ